MRNDRADAGARFHLDTGPNRLVGTDIGTGPAVVLLHAGGERRSVWDTIGPRLASVGYRCLSLDQRGHGESDAEDADSLDGYAADVQVLIEKARGPVVLVGGSLGGFTSLLAAAASPSKVAGLALIDVVPTFDHDRVRAYLAGLQLQGWVRWALVEDILGRTDELQAAAASLRLPTLLVVGGNSPAVGPNELSRVLRLVPFAEIVTIPDAGHLVARDQPEQLAAALEGFLGRPAVRHRHLHLQEPEPEVASA